ncbi:MAG: ABC transporter ATP-binding protein [Myxococcaceae bacterium]
MIRTLLARLLPAKKNLLVPSKERVGSAKIAVIDVLHRYANDVEALKSVNINVHSGEFVCLLGPSGCGKSTLLYALAGHVLPSGGAIAIDGKPVRGPSPERLLMFQEPALFPWLTVKQNLVFALRSKKISRKAASERALEFIRLVELDGFEHALPHQLSGGMRMRTSLARALAMDPAVLLMDEPFGALDAQTRGQMNRLLQDIWVKTRKTVVFVTHDVREALVLGDRVVVMAGRPGRVLQDLEVQLPRPRDPDDGHLVQMSRQIREAIRSAKAAAGLALEREELRANERETRAAADHLPAGVAPPLGAGG